MTYDVVNPGPGLGQAQKCGVELNKLMGSQSVETAAVVSTQSMNMTLMIYPVIYSLILII
jgi:hypothetical protein